MKISYDYEVDALYIRLLDGPQQCRTVRLSDEVTLNMGEGEQLVSEADAEEGALPDQIADRLNDVADGRRMRTSRSISRETQTTADMRNASAPKTNSFVKAR